MKKQFDAMDVLPGRSGWYEVHYAKKDVVEKRYFNTVINQWLKGKYPNCKLEEATGVRKPGNSWSFWFED